MPMIWKGYPGNLACRNRARGIPGRGYRLVPGGSSGRLQPFEKACQVGVQARLHVTAFLHAQHRQAEAGDRPTDAREARRGHAKAVERIVLMRVEPLRHHHDRGSETGDLIERTVERGEIPLGLGAAGKWQVQVVAEPRPGAAFLRAAGIERVELLRIDMQRDRQHVVTFVEDALRAVAVMHVDVEDRRAMAARAQILGRDAAVVEEAEPARDLAIGMMARGARQRIGPARARQDLVGATQRGLRRPVDRLPAFHRDRTGGIGVVVTDLRLGIPGIDPIALGDDAAGHDLGKVGHLGQPAVIDRAQEGQIARRVQRGERRHAVIGARRSRQPRRQRTAQQLRHAVGAVGVQHHLAILQPEARIVQPLSLVEKDLHLILLSCLPRPGEGSCRD
ncbi:hypothetical protein SDC9_32049 [bioreactor metagenome]|uniref:Uncharacterized protein n=1 Tax=bioreactor metagenome TaxID=1076179 RepID=A0A644V5I2_9ZZZZ